MPVFGEYETLAKPLFTRARFGQTRTYWIAQRRGTEAPRDYFIKSIALAAQNVGAPAPPPADPSADFFESIARLNQPQRRHAEGIAPIHAFGRTETGLWYATDYYPRQSLVQFCSTAADITDAGLRHIVHGLASACLALQQGTGRSHGNLKPGNVLLAGEPASLSETPLHLIDVAGFTALRQPLETDPNPVVPYGEPALRETAERRDLLGIGRILLQLVESNPIEGPADYTLPITFSVPWRALGEDSQRWLDLCNRLLAPNLSLNEINLQSLARDFQPVPQRSQAAPLTTGLSVVLIAGTCLALWSQPWKHTSQARTRPPSVISALPSAPTAAGNSVPVAQANRPTVAISPVTRRDTSAVPAMPKTRRPTSATGLPSTPKRIASIVKDKDQPKAVPAHNRTKRTDASPPARTRPLNPTHPANSPAFSTTNAHAPSTLARADSPPGNSAFGACTASTQPEAVHAPTSPAPATRENTPSPSRDTSSSKQVPRTNSEAASSGTTPVSIKQLDEQLRRLETKIGRAVAIRRHSELIDSLDSLELQYAKSNQLTSKTRRRFAIARANLAKKLPGASTASAMNNPFSTPPIARQ
jgi:hypothetical protein